MDEKVTKKPTKWQFKEIGFNSLPINTLNTLKTEPAVGKLNVVSNTGRCD